jgi:hypothetical protein
MNTTLLSPAQWAETEFGLAQLGDQRRTQRLVKIATGLAHSPGGTLPQAFTDWEELKAVYRFVNQPKNTYEGILSPHWERTRAACREAGEYLIIEDTSELDFTGHPASLELGFIGDGRGRGFDLHSTLAVRVAGWSPQERPEITVVGLLGQQCYCPRKRPPGETRAQQLRRWRESLRWAAVLPEVGPPPPGCRWIYTADRESDVYEPIQTCLRYGVDFIIRACQDRCLAGAAGERLSAALARAPVRGHFALELRARPGQPARTARLEVRTTTVTLRGPYRPGGKQPDFTVQVVEAREVDAPADLEPLHWILLTSLPTDSWTAVRRILGRYAARFLVEEYHKALKTGAGVEDSQLERRHRLEALIAVLAVVALRLLNTKLLAEARPDEPVSANEFGPEALAILAALFGCPAAGWTYRSVLVAVARMGGFLARKHDGLPGWQTIWRGWHRLMLMCAGLDILQTKGQGFG